MSAVRRRHECRRFKLEGRLAYRNHDAYRGGRDRVGQLERSGELFRLAAGCGGPLYRPPLAKESAMDEIPSFDELVDTLRVRHP